VPGAESELAAKRSERFAIIVHRESGCVGCQACRHVSDPK
jgi:hypothetical protein